MDWFAGTEHTKIHVTRTLSGYPHALKAVKMPTTGAGKRLRRWTLSAFDRCSSDDAAHWHWFMVPAAERLLRANGVPVLVATGAPFSVNLWAARIKQRHPELKLIQDFRDPWLTEPASGVAGDAFAEATMTADCLVSVTDEMTALFAKLSGHHHTRTIANGVDLEQVRSCRSSAPARLDFAYIGALANGRDVPATLFLQWVRRRRDEGRPVRAAFMGRIPPTLARDFEDLVHSGQLELHGHGPQRDAFALAASARYALHFNGPVAVALTQVTTKLVEHAALGRPTLSLNYGGAVEPFIQERGLGLSLRADAADLPVRLDDSLTTNEPWSLSIDDLDAQRSVEAYSQLIESV